MGRFAPWLIVAGGLGVAYFIYSHFKGTTLAVDLRKDDAVKAASTAASECAAKGGTLRSATGFTSVDGVVIPDCVLPEPASARQAVNYGGCPTIYECKGYDARTGVTNPPPSTPTGVAAIAAVKGGATAIQQKPLGRAGLYGI